MIKSCPSNKILNPITNRCVLKSSIIGKKLIKDYKPIIIKQLSIIKEYEKQQNNSYKVKAYSSVLNQLYNYKNPITNYKDFIDNIKVGEKIAKKVEQLINENKITYIEEKIINNSNFKIKEKLTKIYGIGQIKANELIKKGIKTIEDLKNNKELLNEKQLLGLKYYFDLEKRIPLNEFLHHKSFIEKDLKKNNLIYDFVGSFRRGNKTMGDIDILIMNNNKFNLKNFIKELIELRYIKEILALGKVKFSGIVRLDGGIFRRLDILICPENEYYYSLLYFTGSAEFNIGFRNYVKQNFNISLSEHGIKDNKIIIPLMKSEKDIFDFFKIKYIEPNKRKIFFISQK